MIYPGVAIRILGQCSALPLALALGFLPISAHADERKQDAAVQQVLRKAQGALRQLSQEKAQLETEKSALQELVAKLEASVKTLEPLLGEVERHRASIEALKNANIGLESQLNSGRERERQLHDKLKEIIGQAKLIQGDNLHLVEAVKEREQWIGQCRSKNEKMAEAHAELIQRYQNKGFWDKLGDVEPFTGIGKVQTENIVQDYQFKLEDLKVTPFESKVDTTTSGGERESGETSGQSIPEEVDE